jgi:hypothetical protein
MQFVYPNKFRKNAKNSLSNNPQPKLLHRQQILSARKLENEIQFKQAAIQQCYRRRGARTAK